MKKDKYFGTTLEQQKELTQERLNQFLADPDAKIFFMNEPVGYGKTTTLMDLCLTPVRRQSILATFFVRRKLNLASW